MFHSAPGLCVTTVALVGSLMTGSAVVAQQGASGPIVRGAVYDTISGDPIAFAVISVAGSNVSALTSRAGAFRLAVPRGVQELQFRKIGYRMRSVSVTVDTSTTLSDVHMNPLPFELATVLVTTDDPATRIIRLAIERKNDLLSRIHDYRYDAYVKFIVRDLNKHEDSTASIVLITIGAPGTQA